MKTAVITPLKLLIVAVVYGAIGFLFYRQRGISNYVIWNSDFLVFFFPALLALLANGWITGASLPPRWSSGVRGAITVFVAVLLTLFALGSYLTVAINTYGS